MDLLRVVGHRHDPARLVLAGAGGTTFALPVDDALCEALEALADDSSVDAAPAHPASPAANRAGPSADGHANPGLTAQPGPATPDRPAATDHRAAPASRLAPREIQALLRAGNSPAQVARAAGTGEDWVRRWLPPIEAERERVIAAVGRTPARAHGRAVPLAEAVDVSLRARGVAAETVSWSAQRPPAAAAWTVTVRFREDGAMRRASWRYLPGRQRAEPCSSLATQLADSERRRQTLTPSGAAAPAG